MIAEIDPTIILAAEGNSLANATDARSVAPSLPANNLTASDGTTGDNFDEDFDDDFDEDFDDDFEDDMDEDMDDDDEDDDDEFDEDDDEDEFDDGKDK